MCTRLADGIARSMPDSFTGNLGSIGNRRVEKYNSEFKGVSREARVVHRIMANNAVASCVPHRTQQCPEA